MSEIQNFESMSLPQLRETAKALGVPAVTRLRKPQLLEAVLQAAASQPRPVQADPAAEIPAKEVQAAPAAEASAEEVQTVPAAEAPAEECTADEAAE